MVPLRGTDHRLVRLVQADHMSLDIRLQGGTVWAVWAAVWPLARVCHQVPPQLRGRAALLATDLTKSGFSLVTCHPQWPYQTTGHAQLGLRT